MFANVPAADILISICKVTFDTETSAATYWHDNCVLVISKNNFKMLRL